MKRETSNSDPGLKTFGFLVEKFREKLGKCFNRLYGFSKEQCSILVENFLEDDEFYIFEVSEGGEQPSFEEDTFELKRLVNNIRASESYWLEDTTFFQPYLRSVQDAKTIFGYFKAKFTVITNYCEKFKEISSKAIPKKDFADKGTVHEKFQCEIFEIRDRLERMTVAETKFVWSKINLDFINGLEVYSWAYCSQRSRY